MRSFMGISPLEVRGTLVPDGAKCFEIKSQEEISFRTAEKGQGCPKVAGDYARRLLPCQCASNCSRKTGVGGDLEEIVGETSPFHSSTRRKANGRRKLVLT